METITDDELARIGMLESKDNFKRLYDIDDDLLYIKPRKEKLVNESRSKMGDDNYSISSGAGIGSNCYAVHGSLTKKGKPILTCDPHLSKTMLPFWYLTRLSWTETDKTTGEDYKTYIMGGSFVGIPAFTYGRTPFSAYGGTALNPDVMDMFVEDVKEVDGREVFYDAQDQTYKEFEVIEETIKVRFGRDVTI